jgi:hypothetical protein
MKCAEPNKLYRKSGIWGTRVRGRGGLPRVHSQHAADCSSYVAVRFWGFVAFGDRDCACRTAAIGAHLLPRARRSCLHYGR